MAQLTPDRNSDRTAKPAPSAKPEAEGAPSTVRLEAFSDGVIAVVITIMVLELKVPAPDGLAGVREILPTLLMYLLSFAFTGIYWLNHQHVVRRLRAAGHPFQQANLLFLFFLSLLPWSTAYLIQKNLSSFAVALYAVSLLSVAVSFLVLRTVMYLHLMRTAGVQRTDRIGLYKHLFSICLYMASIPAAFWYPKVTLAGIACVTLLWTFPNLLVRKVSE
jgi:uncharacterized membrane protein